MSHGTHMDKSGHAYEGVMRVMRHATRKASWNNMGVKPGNQEGPGC